MTDLLAGVRVLESAVLLNGEGDIVDLMVQDWNETAAKKGCAGAAPRSENTKKQMRLRWKDTFNENRTEWRAYCERISRAPFLCGQNQSRESPWRADIKWACEPRNVEKVLGGKYDPGRPDGPTDVNKMMGL